MRIWTIYFGILLSLLFFQNISAQKELRPRGFAGLGYRAITQADVDSMNLSDSHGVIVNRILPETPAERAGFQIGDVLKKYDDHAILDNVQFVDVYRTFYADDMIRVTCIRNGEIKTVNLTLAAFPRETSDEVRIEYTSFPSNGAHLRAVVTSPLDRGRRKLPALLIVSALGSPRLIQSSSFYAPRELAYTAAKAGFCVLRFEQRGSGDSEGEDFRTCDFHSELDDNLAAFDYLKHREDVDKNHVFVYGESTGGITAALIAGQRETAGCITSCTIGRTFYERMVETLRLQSTFAGDPPEVTDRKIKTYLTFAVSIAQGDSLPDILRRCPEVSGLVNSRGRIMDDRTLAYWRQQLNFNLPEIYTWITEPVLIVYGESDFLTFSVCHEHIRDILVSSGNPDVALALIPNLDHAYALAKDKKESYENYQSGRFIKNPEVFIRIVDWLSKHAGCDL